jgi:two-component system cell cycle sensor histidine kinase/response regulator CckA
VDAATTAPRGFSISSVLLARAITRLLFALIVLLASVSATSAAETPTGPTLTATVLVGGTTDNYPYSFLDDNDQLSGFAVEIFDAVARQMGLRYRRELGTAQEISARFSAGTIDIHPFFSRSPSVAPNAEYSVPFASLQLALFTRSDDHRVTRLADLSGGPLRIVGGGAGLDYCRASGIPEKNLSRESNNEAFQQLAASEADVAIFTRLLGLATIERLGLKNIKAADLALPDGIRDYRFAVLPGKPHLLAQLNEGLASIRRTGEYDAIYDRWFGRFEPRRFSREEVIGYVAGALALALAITLWALARQRQLRRRLARQADELAESQAIIAEAQRFARVGHWQRVFASGDLIWSDETYRIHDRDPALGPPTMSEMLGWVSPSDRLLWESSARRARDEGSTYEFDATIEPHPGVRKILHIRGRPTRDSAGQINGLFGTVQDITPWREAEHALLRSERLLRAIYDNIPYAMGVVEHREQHWRCVSLNPGATALFALPGSAPRGAKLAELGLDASWQAFWHELFDGATAAGTPQTIERPINATPRDFRISVVPLGTTSGHPRCCFFVEDITERKQKDAEISQGRRLRAIGELVGGIAHEFNNLLTPILLKADLLKSEWRHEPGLVEDLQVIADTARRSADLTRRLLTFGRRTEMRPSLFAIADVVESNFKLLRHTIDRRIALDADMPGDLPPLHLSIGDVQQVVLNLLLNSRDTLAEKLAKHPAHDWRPAIHILAAVLPSTAATPLDTSKPIPSRWLKFSCVDNGMGMAPDVIERAFEPFYTTKEVGQGTGLGLATVWHLVTEMGGRVEVTSAPGDGTAFHIFLPITPPPTVSNADTAATSLATAPSVASAALRPHFLVAEDEEPIALLVTAVLKNLGCEVTHTANGHLAWERLSAIPTQFHAALIDLNMPGITGLEFLRRARQLGFGHPVIVMSGRVGDDERRDLLALGVVTVLQKPFDPEKIREALELAGIIGRGPAK